MENAGSKWFKPVSKLLKPLRRFHETRARSTTFCKKPMKNFMKTLQTVW